MLIGSMSVLVGSRSSSIFASQSGMCMPRNSCGFSTPRALRIFSLSPVFRAEAGVWKYRFRARSYFCRAEWDEAIIALPADGVRTS